jgi:YggT family protein
MFGFGPVNSLGDILATLVSLLSLAILIRALLSWVAPDPRNPIAQALDVITEPILQPLRQVMPRTGGIDFTPMVAIILLQVISALLRSSGI